MNIVKIILLTVVFGIVSCSKTNDTNTKVEVEQKEVKSTFFKEMFRGMANKKTNQDIELEVTAVILDLTRFKNKLQQCEKDNLVITENSIGTGQQTQAAATECYIEDKLHQYRSQPLIFEKKGSNYEIVAVIGGSAHEKIFGKNVIFSKNNSNWQCTTNVDLAYIPVGCNKKY